MIKQYFKEKSKKLVLVSGLMCLLGLALSVSYATFVFSSENYRASEMYIGSLLYTLKIDGQSTSKIKVPSGTSDYIVEIISLNTVDTYYKLVYKTDENISIKYHIDNSIPQGSITNVKTIKLNITNTSTSEIEVELDVMSGYITNTLEQVIVLEGYTPITEELLLLNDINILSFKVDDTPTTILDTTKKYYVKDYTCNNENVEITFNNDDFSFEVWNYDKQTDCEVDLTTKNYLSLAELGSYVLYTGSNGCTTTTSSLDTVFNSQCKGMNANYASANSMGYCYNSTYFKFTVTGWRLAYTKDTDGDGKKEAYLISAGSPECVTGTDSDPISTISLLNNAAVKYCNPNYAYGGTCQSTYDATSSNTNAMNGIDFYNITEQWFGEGRRLYSYDTTTEMESGTTCRAARGQIKCGSNSDIIDNANYYWFASAYNDTSTLYYLPTYRYPSSTTSGTRAYGIRPVIHLKNDIYITGGSGSASDPYTISY